MNDTMEYASMRMLAEESRLAAKWARKRAALEKAEAELEKAEAAEWAALRARHLPSENQGPLFLMRFKKTA